MPKTLRLNKDWLKANHINTRNFLEEVERIVVTYKEETQLNKTGDLLRWWAAESLEFRRLFDFYKKQAKVYRRRYYNYVKKHSTKRRKKRGET